MDLDMCLLIWRAFACSLSNDDFYWEIKLAIFANLLYKIDKTNTHYIDKFINDLSKLEDVIGPLNFNRGLSSYKMSRIGMVNARQDLPV